MKGYNLLLGITLSESVKLYALYRYSYNKYTLHFNIQEYTQNYTATCRTNNISLIGFIFNLFDLQYVSSTINITILLHLK